MREPEDRRVPCMAEGGEQWVTPGDRQSACDIVGGEGINRAPEVAVKTSGVGPDAELDGRVPGHGRQAGGAVEVALGLVEPAAVDGGPQRAGREGRGGGVEAVAYALAG